MPSQRQSNHGLAQSDFWSGSWNKSVWLTILTRLCSSATPQNTLSTPRRSSHSLSRNISVSQKISLAQIEQAPLGVRGVVAEIRRECETSVLIIHQQERGLGRQAEQVRTLTWIIGLLSIPPIIKSERAEGRNINPAGMKSR
ncbi:MAG: hypothetical protein OXF60_05835 [Gammaproteobacteria bacterium]|nr:hypothetical protein [Gammaproteobacteria bacterium]MCY4219779.1 hypothetical protein [Gammaproteobacteria bacterium]